MLYQALLRPLLFLKDPEKTHEQTLALLARLGFLKGTLKWLFGIEDRRLEVKFGSMTFPNPVGLAAGFDKNGRAVEIWPGFGFGFVEIGAVTAHPQPGNPRPRLFRLPKDQALINRLGFNNEGAEAIANRLAALRKGGRWPEIALGINIGRSKIVETKDATGNYLFTFERLYPYGDYFTLNVSSPNTPNLRELQEKGRLTELLQAIGGRNRELAQKFKIREKPVLVKIAPDMEFSQLEEIIAVAQSLQLSGIIATNATAFLREQLTAPNAEPGGLSGRPLQARSTAFIRHIYRVTRGRLPVIGSGGIFTAEDAYEKITAGATAVQIYTGFVYEGPGAVRRINRGLLRLLQRDGFKALSEAVGTKSKGG